MPQEESLVHRVVMIQGDHSEQSPDFPQKTDIQKHLRVTMMPQLLTLHGIECVSIW